MKHINRKIASAAIMIALAGGILAGSPATGFAQDAAFYKDLAEKHKPEGKDEKLIKRYMNLATDKRQAFVERQQKKNKLKAGDAAEVIKTVLGPGAYATCYYAGLEGTDSSDEQVMKIGKECHDKFMTE
jgi:hypothetical protein